MFRNRLLWLGLVIGALAGPVLADDSGQRPEGYENHKVVRIDIRAWAQIDKLHELGALLMSEAEGLGPVDYVIPPEALPGLDGLGVTYKVLNENIQRDIDAEFARLASEVTRDPNDPLWFNDYKTLAQVNAKLNKMATDHPELASVFSVGTTLEGRTIYGVRISSAGTGKPAIQINGCHHAREWISVMVPLWIADRLVYEYGTNSQIHSLVDKLEWFIIPVVNLDGYVYTWTPNNRLWRKNRRLNAGGCYGVDDNRNYAVGWGGGGSSSDPCNETYRGTAAFSELETAAMRDFTIAHPQIVSTMSYHSYSQLVMSPYGWTTALPADNDTFMELDKGMHDQILATHGVQYDYGPIYTTIYQASGGDVDWYYDHEGIFSFTIELRDTGTYGFELPPAQIIPTSEENFAAMMYLADWSSSPVKITFPNGVPTRVDPNIPTPVRVKIMAVGATLDAASPRLYARIGSTGPYTAYTLTALGSNLYDATLPATPCGQTVNYYFTASTTTGIVGTSPSDAPATVYSATAAPIVVMLNTVMDRDPGWTTQGQWQWGHPTGGGSYNHDPTNGHTGTNVYGYNLSGDYANSLSVQYLTTPAINCTGVTGVTLEFWRWLGVESNSNYDKATVEVSNNGTTWTVVWSAASTGAAVSDSSWVFQSFDISAVANNQAAVKIRWGMGPTDVSVTYPGWNIDDVKVWAGDPAGCPPPTGACCQTDGSCSVTTQAACTGSWQGAGTTCNPNPCPQPTGACCQTGGSCSVTTQAACTGTWQGAGTVCSPNPCTPSVCPGDANCDHVISWRDIDYFVTGMNDSESAWTAKFLPGTPSCAFANCDVNGDSHVSWRDITPFVGLMNTTCP